MRFIVAILLLCATSILPASLFVLPAEVFAYTSPGKPTGFVNDFAGIISLEGRAQIEERLVAFEKETGNEIVVVTINELVDETIENYAVKLFGEWGIGKADKDTGALLLISVKDREIRIEVGYGLEPYITDAISSRIIRDVLTPAFQAEKYSEGISDAIDKIIGVFNGTEDFSKDRMGAGIKSSIFSALFGEFLPFLIIVLVNLIPVIIYSKSWWLGGLVGFVLGLIVFSSVLAAGMVALLGLIIDFILSKKFGGKGPKSGGGINGVWFGGLGGGRGFGGGGFGGFGGGMSGGGGASGRW